MKSRWLAIAIVAAVPAAALAQQDAKDNSNTNKDESAQIHSDKARAEVEKVQADIAMKESKQAIEAQAYDRALGKVREQRQIKAAWLGLSASQAPPALRRQLKLPDGTGLVIDFIQPDSPAAKAGLKQYDLLTKLNAQLLINSEQLSVLVRTLKPGNKVHLEFLREGEHQGVDAELVEHEVPPLAEETGGGSPFQFQPLSLEGTRIRSDDARVNGGALEGDIVTPGGVNRIQKKPPAHERRTLTLVDGKRQFSVEVGEDGHRTLNVVDNGSGQLISKYPVDNDTQIHALPDDIRKATSRLFPLLNSYDRNGNARKGDAPDAGKGNPDSPPTPDGKDKPKADAKPGF